MVTRNEVKKDVLNHFDSLEAEQTQDEVGFADIDGLGLKIFAAIGISKSFTGSPLKQFDRVYQFIIKYDQTDVTSNLTDSGIIRERDVGAFLDFCKRNNMAVGIIDGVHSSLAVAPYSKHMIIRGRLESFIDMHEASQIISGQPILRTYKALRSLHSRNRLEYEKAARAVVATNNFSVSFRKMMRTLGEMDKALEKS